MQTQKIKASSVQESWSCLDRAGFAISRLRALELGKYGLSIEQSSILYILSNSRQGNITLGELENITMRQHHSISVLISGMESSGLVKKVKFQDGRRLKIEVTAEGLKLYRRTTIASLEESFSTIDQEKWDELSAGLTDLLVKSRDLLGLKTDSPVKISDETTNTKIGLPTHELWTLLDRTRFAVSRLRGLELARFGLTVEQDSILNILSEEDDITVQDLENLTMRQQHSISSLLKGMIKMGVVIRMKTDQDKRFRIVTSADGKQLFGRLTVISLDQVFSVLTPSRRQALTGFLNDMLVRARYLLGVSYQPPFLQHLIEGKAKIQAP